MRLEYLYLLACFIPCLVACSKADQKRVLVLPPTKDIEVYKGLLDGEEDEPADSLRFTIVTFINGDCYYCLNELNSWHLFFEKHELGDKVSLDIYIFSIDFNRFKQLISFDTSLILKAPLFLDINGKVYKEHILIEGYSSERNAFLLNDKKEILVAGNPLTNRAVEHTYLSTVGAR